MPTTVSVAPTTPLDAAKRTHMMMVPTASPPGIRRVHIWIASNSRLAVPERSSIAPMKTKRGAAAMTWFEVISWTLATKRWTVVPPNSSTPKTSATLISAKATGTPRKIKAISGANMISAESMLGLRLLCEEAAGAFYGVGEYLQSKDDKAKGDGVIDRPDHRIPF